jgi:transcription elongation factor Elf1
MTLEEKISLLNKVLNQKARIRKGTDAVYFCPKCKHHKRKLEINLTTGKYNCWVCSFSGLNLTTLLRKLDAPKKYYSLLNDTVTRPSPFHPVESIRIDFGVPREEIVSPTLPDEYRPLHIFNNTSEYRDAINYLIERKVTKSDILRYRIGYCPVGFYKHRIIVPSHDKEGSLNFFVGRSYYNSPLKYSNSETSKDVIGFESAVDFNQELTLVEGVFDALAVRYNCVPLFGKNLSRRLKSELISTPPPVVNVLLDSDAFTSATRIVEFLMKNNISTRLINIGKKDPSVIGFDETWRIIRQSDILDFESMVAMKMRLNYECEKVEL